jgi:hypothetical protein
MRRATHARLVAALAALAVCGAPAVAPAQDVAVRGEIVHTMAGPAKRSAQSSPSSRSKSIRPRLCTRLPLPRIRTLSSRSGESARARS